jgi:transposase
MQLTIDKSLSQLRFERDYYTTKQVAEIYNVHVTTIANWCRKGWLKAEKKSDGKNSRWHIYPQQLEDEIEMHKDELIALSRKYWPMLLQKMRR